MLAWRPELLRPYESGWALLQRFQALNCPSIGELNTLLGSSASETSVFVSRSNFGSSAAFDQHKFEMVLHIPEVRFQGLFDGLHGLDVFNPTCETLRYCPACMRMGFHSPLHQATALRLCPVHLEELRETCPNCKTSVGYDLSKASRKNLFACSNGHPLVDLDDLKSLLSPLPAGMIDTLNAFTNTAHIVAADRRKLHWIFDKSLQRRADCRAFWLFAQVIGADSEFLRCFYEGRVRVSVMGKSDPPLPPIVVDWEANGDYQTDLLLKAHRWFRHVENPMFHPSKASSVKAGKPHVEVIHKCAWGVSASDANSSKTKWRDFWTRNPSSWIETPRTGAMWGVTYNTVAQHSYRNHMAQSRGVKPDEGYLIDERIFRWAFRKMLTALYVGTYRMAAKIDRWAGEVTNYPDRMPPQMGLWAFPRCYLLIGGEEAAMMVMEPDFSSPWYRASIESEPNAAIRRGGRRFLDYLDCRTPSVRREDGQPTSRENPNLDSA